jgi:two-component system NtrC family sensor kinase
MRILMIDDEANILEILARALRRQGYPVDTVTDGETALARLSEVSYDLIVCDVRMPGLSGPEIYRRVQDRNPDLARRTIFTTGDGINPTTQRFFDETGVPYLNKPFGLADLVEKVRAMMADQ